MNFVKFVVVFVLSFIIVPALLTMLAGSLGGNVGIVEYGLLVLFAPVIVVLVARKVGRKLR